MRLRDLKNVDLDQAADDLDSMAGAAQAVAKDIAEVRRLVGLGVLAICLGVLAYLMLREGS